MSESLKEQIERRRREAAASMSGTAEGDTSNQAAAVAARMQSDAVDKAAVMVLVDQIEVKDQARKTFTPESLAELADSIRTHGLFHPLVVKKEGPFRYRLVAGERRLRAMRDLLKLDMVPARIIDNLDNEITLRMAQIGENAHREDYQPMELAVELDELKRLTGWTLEQLAAELRLSKGWVSKRLSLLDAPLAVQEKIRSGDLAETTYYNNKEAVVQGVEQGLDADKIAARTVQVSVPYESALEVAKLLQALAGRGDNPIVLSEKPTKKELAAILARAGELRTAL